jgi:hypothetical protein
VGSFLFSFSLFWILGALLNPVTRDAAQIANVAFGREGFLLWLANNMTGRGDFAFGFCHYCHESVKRAERWKRESLIVHHTVLLAANIRSLALWRQGDLNI